MNWYISSNKPLLKNDKLKEQEMPRAAKDLLRRQLAIKNKTTMKKIDKKKKKQGTKWVLVLIWLVLLS